MTVYVLTSNYINVDSGDYDNTVIGVYTSIDKALEQLKDCIKDARYDFQDEDYEESNYCEGDMTYSIWHKEYEMTYRCDLAIEECLVIGD